MRVHRRNLQSVAFFIGPFLLTLAAVTAGFAQGSYEAQVRGTVTDQSGAMVVNATVTITNDATNISQSAHSDDHGQYFLTGLRPAVYTVKVEASGFRISEKKNLVLQVDQQTSADFVLHPLGVSESIEVKQTAPLMDTESATLGTDISSEYVHELPLANRSFFGLTVLAAGVNEVAGSGTSDNYPSGTNFTSIFPSRGRHTRYIGDWSSDCALPIYMRGADGRPVVRGQSDHHRAALPNGGCGLDPHGPLLPDAPSHTAQRHRRRHCARRAGPRRTAVHEGTLVRHIRRCRVPYLRPAHFLLQLHPHLPWRLQCHQHPRQDDDGAGVRDLLHAGDAAVLRPAGREVDADRRHVLLGGALSSVRHRLQRRHALAALSRPSAAWRLLRLLLRDRLHLCGQEGAGDHPRQGSGLHRVCDPRRRHVRGREPLRRGGRELQFPESRARKVPSDARPIGLGPGECCPLGG